MNTKELAKKLATYKAVTEKLEAECKTPEAAYEALKELGLTDSFEQFKQAAKELAAEAAKMSQEEIEAVVAAADYDDEAETKTSTDAAESPTSQAYWQGILY